jgi:hypothetical protein
MVATAAAEAMFYSSATTRCEISNAIAVARTSKPAAEVTARDPSGTVRAGKR